MVCDTPPSAVVTVHLAEGEPAPALSPARKPEKLLQLAARELAEELISKDEFLRIRDQHLRIKQEAGSSGGAGEQALLEIAATELAEGHVTVEEFVNIVSKDHNFRHASA